jgi:hypothetical protein
VVLVQNLPVEPEPSRRFNLLFTVEGSGIQGNILPAVASIDPCAQQQKLVKLVLPVENLMYSSVNLDGGYMKRSFVCSQWFLLSSETYGGPHASVTVKVNSHGKIKLTHGKIKLTHGKIKLTHGKIELTHGKIK